MIPRGMNLFFMLVLFPLASGVSGVGVTEITAHHNTTGWQVRFDSGDTTYVERLRDDGRWVSYYWATKGHSSYPTKTPDEDAFTLRIAREPLHGAAPVSVSTGWQWVSAAEESKNEKGHRHYVIELSNPDHNIKLKIHTLLDGTSVLTRRLEITNTSDKPIALMGVSPWAGKLWSQGPEYELGYFTRSHWTWEGWFDWTSLPCGTTLIRNEKGMAHDDPFFIVRNKTRGEQPVL